MRIDQPNPLQFSASPHNPTDDDTHRFAINVQASHTSAATRESGKPTENETANRLNNSAMTLVSKAQKTSFCFFAHEFRIFGFFLCGAARGGDMELETKGPHSTI